MMVRHLDDPRARMRAANRDRLDALDAAIAARLSRREHRAMTRPDPLAGDPAAIAERTAALRAILRGDRP
jgi:hypothetical protein